MNENREKILKKDEGKEELKKGITKSGESERAELEIVGAE